MLHFLQNLVFPPVCEGCQATLPFSNKAPVCPSCSSKIQLVPSPSCPLCARHWPPGGKCLYCKDQKSACDAVHVAFLYEGTLQSILQAYKFSKRRSLGPFLSERLCRFAQERLAGEALDAVIAVPADSSKISERGFNPPQDLAKAVSRSMGIPDCSSWLGARKGRAQVSLSREDRRQNVRGRFYVRGNPAALAQRSILLVDDVLTTGSTIAECAWVLQGAGTASVTALCLARGEWQ